MYISIYIYIHIPKYLLSTQHIQFQIYTPFNLTKIYSNRMLLNEEIDRKYSSIPNPDFEWYLCIYIYKNTFPIGQVVWKWSECWLKLIFSFIYVARLVDDFVVRRRLVHHIDGAAMVDDDQRLHREFQAFWCCSAAEIWSCSDTNDLFSFIYYVQHQLIVFPVLKDA